MTTLNKLFNNIPEKQHVLGSSVLQGQLRELKEKWMLITELKEIGDQDRPEKVR